MQESLVHCVAQSEEEIERRSDVQRNRRCQSCAEHAQFRRAQVAKYQYPVQEDIDRMHDQQCAQVHTGHVDGTPVTTE